MPAMGQKQTSRHVRIKSVIPLKADIHQRIESCMPCAQRGNRHTVPHLNLIV